MLVTGNLVLSSSPIQRLSTISKNAVMMSGLPVDSANLFGQVTDKDTGDTLCGASIVVKDYTNAVIASGATNLLGMYDFNNLPETICTIEVYYPGYNPQHIGNIELFSGYYTQVNVALEQNL
ncbi:MAG: hypothetical protein A2322_06895 [Bacteroidetes bacterium RIFOXYB2_FULL_39_7]|nr:MAG: hypothetical protein A2322_06895 [Bacteroidetes bacterium RIFOXYB2_FULL_39_7]